MLAAFLPVYRKGPQGVKHKVRAKAEIKCSVPDHLHSNPLW